MANFEQQVWKKLTPTLFKSLESATAFCKLRGAPYVELVHWLHQLLQRKQGDMVHLCSVAGVDQEALEEDLVLYMSGLKEGSSSVTAISEHVIQSISQAWSLASLMQNDQKIRGAWLLAAIAQSPDLKRHALSISRHFQSLFLLDFGQQQAVLQASEEHHEVAYDQMSATPAAPGEYSGATSANRSTQSLMEQFCTDLTQQARSGLIDPVVGRVQEIRTAIDVLLRRRQNNPLLTGDAGVGKTAVVEGLALAIVAKDTPPALHDCRLLSLDIGALLAGASMKGEFEARLKGVMDEIARSKQGIILFIDEIHNLIGAGGQAGVGDAANLLKPALARGTLRTIGATTWSEYKKGIEKDAALSRRFQVLQIQEPTLSVAEEMVRAVSDKFANHHDVLITDDAIRAAVHLSHRYIPSRQLPDKAISLLDTACSRVHLSLQTAPAQIQHLEHRLLAINSELILLEKTQYFTNASVQERLQRLQQEHVQHSKILNTLRSRWQEEQTLVNEIHHIRIEMQQEPTVMSESTASFLNLSELQDHHRLLGERLERLQSEQPFVFPEVNEKVVADIVSEWTGIPLGQMLQSEQEKIAQLEPVLQQRVIGQDYALRALSQRIQVSRSGLADPNKPIGVFLLVGPSGVGKTETALALADMVYGGERALITINMSEYQEAHTISSLKGSPPGYVGYGEGGVLTEAVRKRPHSVVLLDEIEKAHPDVHELFFQVFDKGWMEDSEGRLIDFRNTIILLTSNLGAELIEQLVEDPDLAPTPSVLANTLQAELKKGFPIAFLGRLTVIPYLPLPLCHLDKIVRKHLDQVVQRLWETQGISLEYTDSVVEQVIQMSSLDQTGARGLIQTIERQILPDLAQHWFSNMTQQQKIAAIQIDTAGDPSSFVYQHRMVDDNDRASFS